MSDPILTIQKEVDSILFEEGAFSSIAWLLREGHLSYGDYQNWRKGGKGYLEDYFKTALPVIIASLKVAQRYAEKLKLGSYCQAYTSIAQQSLKVCWSAAEELIFTTVYQPARDRVQTDLFFDSAHVFVIEDLIRAIVDQRNDTIPNLLTKLKSLAPEKHLSFERLLAQQEQLMRHSDTGSKIEYLQNVLTPSLTAMESEAKAVSPR